MQLGALALLLGTPQAAGQQAGSGADSGDKSTDLFSTLLNDLQADANGATPLQNTAAVSEWINQPAAATLVAQEVPTQQAAALSTLLNQQVTPQNADDLLQAIQAMASKNGGDSAQLQTQADAGTTTTSDQQSQADTSTDTLLAQLKDAITDVKETGQPAKLGDIVAQLPAMQQVQGEAKQGAQLQSVLQLVKQVFSGLKNQNTTEQAQGQPAAAQPEDSVPDATTQSLQASLFPADDTAAAPQEKDKDKDGERDYVEIVPLSAEATMPAWVNNLTPAPKPDGSSTIAQNDLDATIPPLSSGNAPSAALPKVNLPSMHADDADDADGSSDDASDGVALPSGMHSFSETLAAQQTNDKAAAPVTAPNDAAAAQATSASSTQHNNAAAAAAAATSNAQNNAPVNHAPVTAQVQVAVTRAVHEGIQQMTIQLDPADLGRVEVHLHTQTDGQTHVSFVVDKAQTLDSLSRDARSLERSLQDAGVKADAGNMQFNLRQQPQSNLGTGGGQFGQGGRPQWSKDEDDKDGSGTAPQASAISATQNYTLSLRDGVDIRA